ncbi:MAG: hypothetical protein ACTSXY_12320 [Promethearchaeota archaeon]
MKRLETAMENSEKIKLIFQYPASDRAIIKSGFVIECFKDCFWFDEKFDGKTTYSYKFLVEIKGDNR